MLRVLGVNNRSVPEKQECISKTRKKATKKYENWKCDWNFCLFHLKEATTATTTTITVNTTLTKERWKTNQKNQFVPFKRRKQQQQ